MAQTYNVIYSTKAYNGGVKAAKQSVVIGAGKLRCITIDFPHHGRITGLTVKQDSGEANQFNFTVELLKSSFPFQPDTDLPVATSPNDDLTHYRIVPSQTAITAGQAYELDTNNQGYPYRNLDGTFTLNQRKIYLLISPVSATSATTWEFSVTGEQDASS